MTQPTTIRGASPEWLELVESSLDNDADLPSPTERNSAADSPPPGGLKAGLRKGSGRVERLGGYRGRPATEPTRSAVFLKVLKQAFARRQLLPGGSRGDRPSG